MTTYGPDSDKWQMFRPSLIKPSQSTLHTIQEEILIATQLGKKVNEEMAKFSNALNSLEQKISACLTTHVKEKQQTSSESVHPPTTQQRKIQLLLDDLANIEKKIEEQDQKINKFANQLLDLLRMLTNDSFTTAPRNIQQATCTATPTSFLRKYK